MTCDEIYLAVIEGREGNYVLFDMAACFLSGYDPERLRAMLQSSDFGIVSDGLFIAGEIGSLASNYLEDLEALAKSDDEEIARRASDLLSVYGGFNEGDEGRNPR